MAWRALWAYDRFPRPTTLFYVTCANDHPYDPALDDVNIIEGAIDTKYVRLQSG